MSQENITAAIESASRAQLQLAVKNLLNGLSDLGFGTDDEIDGGDAVEAIGELYRDTITRVLGAPSADEDITVDAGPEVLPGATRCEIAVVNMIDIVGDYDDPGDVPEWLWVERNASFVHVDNENDGYMDFIVNVARTFENIPKKIEPVIDKARQEGMAYLQFHQGT